MILLKLQPSHLFHLFTITLLLTAFISCEKDPSTFSNYDQITQTSIEGNYKIDFNTEFLPTSEYIESRKQKIKPYKNLWNHIWRGSMPELADESIEWEPFYRSYIRTYLDHDVADIISQKNLQWRTPMNTLQNLHQHTTY